MPVASVLYLGAAGAVVALAAVRSRRTSWREFVPLFLAIMLLVNNLISTYLDFLFGADPASYPWIWIANGPIDLTILVFSADAEPRTRERWHWAMRAALFSGLVLYVWLFAMSSLHHLEGYKANRLNYRFYWRATNTLALIELACVAWPSLHTALVAGVRLVDRGALRWWRVPDGGRHQA